MSAIDIAKQNSLDRQESQAQSGNASGYDSGRFLGYTKDSNGRVRWLVLVNGDRLKCKGITNASPSIGQRCSVGRPRGGTPFAKVAVR